jgi:hypothetical protein
VLGSPTCSWIELREFYESNGVRVSWICRKTREFVSS